MVPLLCYACRYGGDFCRRVTQLLQRGGGQGGVVALCYGGGNAGAGEIQFHGTAADLVLQLQNDALGQLFAHALGGGEKLFIPGHHGQRKVLRTGREDGHSSLGAHTGDRGQHFVAPLLFPADKAVEVKSIFSNGFGDEQLGCLIQFQLGGSIGGNTATVPNATAVDNGQTGLQNSHRAGYIVEHRKTS